MKEPRIVLLERDDVAREVYTEYLVGAGFRVRAETLFDDAVAALRKGGVPLLVAGIAPGGATVAQLAAAIRRVSPHSSLCAILGREAAEAPLRAVRDGALEVLTRPVAGDALVLAVERCLRTVALLERHPDMRRHVEMYQAARRLQRAPDLAGTAEQLLDTAILCGGADAGFALAPTGAEGARELVCARQLDEATARELAAGWDPKCLSDVPGPAGWWIAGTGPMVAIKGRISRVAAELIAMRVGPLGRESLWITILYKKEAPARGDAARAALLAELALYAAEAEFALLRAAREGGDPEPSIDALTDLPDLRTLERTLAHELGRVKRSGGAASVLSIEVDHIEEIAEAHGQVAGAQALIEAARIVLRAVRDMDVVARTGAHEFGVALMGTDGAGAQRAAQRILDVVQGHRFLAREGLDLRLGAAVGVAAWPANGTTARALLEAAAAARGRARGAVGIAPSLPAPARVRGRT
jgi:diguanylate cyclase (GGDEF)-like protein